MRDKKASILYEHMRGELDNLYRFFLELNLLDKDQSKAIPPETVKTAIGEFLIQCPVYRYYGNHLPLSESEATAVQSLLDKISTSKPKLTTALSLLKEVLLTKPQSGDPAYNDRASRFYQRCMQFTGPLMAKGVEDTLMYTYTRFIGHDEVGDSPEFFGLTVDEFHQKMIDRQVNWPLALNATSTHDTKRGEDVRSRLNVLTDLADEWVEEVRVWQQLNQVGEAPIEMMSTLFIRRWLVLTPCPARTRPLHGKRISLTAWKSIWRKHLERLNAILRTPTLMKPTKMRPKRLPVCYWIRSVRSGSDFSRFIDASLILG
ncbi:hypothetical protein [Spirosoma telluris]|uniref:hypothetical protein n=1 Tax=Spirosoma telluris TaxID=2183553 RepID=UPI002FC34CB8